jgi:hypothetical protein
MNTFLLLFAYWLWAFFAAIALGAFVGFKRAGAFIAKNNAGTTPGKAVLMTIGSVALVFGGWFGLVLSEATLFTDGIPDTSLTLLFAVLGVAATFFGSFTGVKLARLLHFSSSQKATPPESH